MNQNHCKNHHKNHDNNQNLKIYTCPMHPEVKRSASGLCPECGMKLMPTKKDVHQHHSLPKKEIDKHAGHSTAMFLKKFWVSLVLTIPVVIYSELPQVLFGWQAPSFLGSNLIGPILGSIVFFYGGWVFLVGMAQELKARLPGMMTLIGLAISVAYLYSLYVSLISQTAQQALFWELTTLIVVMLFGHWLEMKAVSGAQGALKELSKLLPDTAEVIYNGKSKILPVSQLREGNLVFVRPGARVPADGLVLEGESEVNEAMVTGESAPVKKTPGCQVIAGTINGDGSLKVKVTKVGENTFLAGVMRLVQEAQASKSRLQILSDKAAFYLTIIAVGAGILSFVAWLLSQAGFGFALERLVAVLVIACPHALGLAIPLVAIISTALAAQNGFLIRQRLALELARKIDIVLFDKTGTLTKGSYGITNIWPLRSTEKELLQLAASVDAHSEHFISQAIVKFAKNKNIPLLPVKEFSRLPGKGVRGIVSGKEVLVGGWPILEKTKDELPENIQEAINKKHHKGETIIFVVCNQKIWGCLALADIIREESYKAVSALKSMGLKVAMITGDSEEVAWWVAKDLGIDTHFARVLPQDKAAKVKLLQEKGYKVAMVGDGINDAPALTQADLGIAIGAGTNVAIESAGIILVRNNPQDIVKIIKLSRLTYRKMIQNLFWATGYNVIALPLAAGVLYFKGILLQPALAALFMSLSTIIVAFNAILLKRKSLND